MTVAQEMLELAEKIAKAEAQSFWHPEIGGDPVILVNMSFSPRERELAETALRSSALSLNEVGGERKI